MNDSTSPYFESDFNKTEMMVLGTFDKLSAKLHIDSFLNLYEFGMSLLPKEAVKEAEEEEKKKSEGAKTSDVVLREKSIASTASDIDVIKVYRGELFRRLLRG